MPTFDASHFISKVLEKLGEAKRSTLVSFFLELLKRRLLFFSPSNGTSFFTYLLIGEEKLEKLGTSLEVSVENFVKFH